MRNLVIYGDSAFAERLSSYIILEKRDKLIGYTNDDSFITRSAIKGLPVMPFSKLKDIVKEDFEIILGIGYTKMNNLRKKVYEECKEAGFVVGNYISSQAIIYSDKLDEGTIILPNVMIGPGTKIGKCNFFESSVSVSHDSTIGDFNFISTGVVIGGYSNIMNHCFIGLNSTIKNDIIIMDYSLIGAGSNVLHTTECGGVFYGNPAKKIKNKKSIGVRIH